MITDLRFAFRSLLKTPGFTLVAVLTLALGIGASTAVFSIVNAVVLRPLAYPAAQRLVAIRVILPAFAQTYPTLPVNARFYQEWRAGCPALSDLALVDRGRSTLTGNGEPVRVSSVRASVNLFTTLRITPALGRAFADNDDAAGKPAVAVLSDRFWRTQFSADPAVVGRTIMLDQRPVTVIGVLPGDFRLPEARQFQTGQIIPSKEPEVFVPKRFEQDELDEIVGRFNYEVIGRLAPGVTPSAAVAQMDGIAMRLARLSGSDLEARSFLVPLQEAVVGPARRGLFLLLGAIGAVLLIACLNLSLLALARAERRGHDFSVRSALGASRTRLLREVLVESLVLSLSGGALGCLFSSWGLDLLLRLAPGDLPRLDEVRLDPAVLLFALSVTAITALIAGFLPAWRAARADASSALRSSAGRTTTGSVGSRRLRQLLVAVEAGVGLVLLGIAALLGASFLRLMHVDAGFRAPGTIHTELAIPSAKYGNDADRNAYHRRLLAAVAATPGVTAAAITTALPLQGETWIDSVWAPGDSRPRPERPQTNVRFISADFFPALGIPVIAGRTFRDSDQERKVVILSVQLAARLFPGQDPVGRHVLRGAGDSYEVLGIVGDVRANADQRPVPVLYQPYWAWSPGRVILLARVTGSAVAIAPALRETIHRLDADVPVGQFHTMQDILETSVAQRRFQMQLSAVFALSALTLVGLGLYGVVSHSVTQRTRELGVRLAFGAEPADIRRLVLRQGLAPIVWGLLGGVVAALIGGRILTTLLYETSAHNPVVLGTVAAVLTIVATLACLIPARRATRVDPMVALRAE